MKKIREMSMGKKALALIVALALLLAGIPMTVTALDQTLTCESVSVTGNFPDGAELLVTEVHNADDYIHSGTTILFAYDIKIMADGVEWQPDEPVLVSIASPELTEQQPVMLTHIEHNEETGEEIPQLVANTIKNGVMEFETDGFSVFVVTMGGYSPRVSFNYSDESFDVQYCTTIGGTYKPLNGDVTVEEGAQLFFTVTGGSAIGVFYNGITAMTPNTNGVYTVSDITENISITLGRIVTLNVGYGSIAIGGDDGIGGRQYTYSDADGAQTGIHLESNIYTITGTTGSDIAGGNNVSLTGSGDFNVVLSDVSIYTGTPGNTYVGLGICAPISTSGVTGNGKINITLDGENVLKNLSFNASDSYAALEKDNTASTLIINGDGTLYATGGADSAGIGGSNNAPGSGATRNITINGGTIVATSVSSQGAGIGSSDNDTAYNIRIYGGTITAIGVSNGAGIGGSGSVSFTATDGEVYIFGGTIDARTNGSGAGIGGGGSSNDGIGGDFATVGGNGVVHIYGGDITTTSIGGGSGNGSGGGATVNITGGKMILTGGIGGGNSANGTGGTATVNISGGTTVAARISGGYSGGIDLFEDATLNITGGSVDIGDRSNINSITDGNGTELYLNTVSVSGGANTPITSLILSSGEYNCEGIVADENGNIHVWLPIDVTVTSINGVSSVAIVPTATISHTSRELGAVLTAVLNNGTAVAYQWERSTDSAGTSWNAITGATYQDYTTTSLDVGKLVRVSITALNSEVYRSGGLNIYANTFVVTIPESINMVTETGRFAITNSRSGFAGKTFRVTVNPTSDDFKLALQANSQQTLDYALYADSARTNSINSGGVAASFYGNGSNSVNVYYAVIDEPAYAGQYTDTLTFTVNLDP